MNNSDYASKTLDHLGLVAGMCREIGLGDIIDQCCPSESEDQPVSTGKAVEAMILNGLGFVNKRLYLVSRFFEDKPLDRLLGPDITAEQLNDDRLGRALDKLYETGLTTIFTQISRRTFEVLDYHPDRGHLDSTSMSVYGRYNSDQAETSELHITPGYSKDHRPDLPQVTLQLICEHLGGYRCIWKCSTATVVIVNLFVTPSRSLVISYIAKRACVLLLRTVNFTAKLLCNA